MILAQSPKPYETLTIVLGSDIACNHNYLKMEAKSSYVFLTNHRKVNAQLKVAAQSTISLLLGLNPCRKAHKHYLQTADVRLKKASCPRPFGRFSAEAVCELWISCFTYLANIIP